MSQSAGFSHRVHASVLCCPDCGGELVESGSALDCAACEVDYPLVNGVPQLGCDRRAFSEHERSEAAALLADTRAQGWKEAVARHFPPGDEGGISILDWQRAAWLPLLNLPTNAAVLDVGSGYGAITHALAEHFEDVHAIEALPERAEFTRLRLDQSGYTAARVIAGSPVHLPYADESFDAIVVNNILEWIGDWDRQGTPREAQLRFLRKLHSLLKPGGMLVVGIENRLSYTSFLGAIDHSGLSYTNLLPRAIASAAVGLAAKRQRALRVGARTYRTYTYTEKGYRTLFGESGFSELEPFWAEPGSNQPYRLTPLDDRSVAVSLVEMQANARPGPLSSAGRLKRILSGMRLFKYFVPEFVFIVRKAGEHAPSLRSTLPISHRSDARLLLTTYPFAEKTTIRASADGHMGLVIKCSTPTERSRARIAREYTELESMAEIARYNARLMPFRVSRPLGLVSDGVQLMTFEACAPGQALQMLFAPLSASDQEDFLRRHLPALCTCAASIATLSQHRAEHIMAKSWLRAAARVLPPGLAERTRVIGDRYREWMCHGDFTLENCLYSHKAGVFTVIDWEFVRDGVPPLYDLFTLFLSILNSIKPVREASEKTDDETLAKFYTLFFHPNELSRMMAECTARECAVLGVDRGEIWQLFEDSLLFRIGYLLERRSSMADSRLAFVIAMQEWRSDFQL